MTGINILMSVPLYTPHLNATFASSPNLPNTIQDRIMRCFKNHVFFKNYFSNIGNHICLTLIFSPSWTENGKMT